MGDYVKNESNKSNAPDYPKVSLVIPTLNEATNLPYVLPKIPSLVDEIIIVDACSTDGTAEIAKKLRPDIQIVNQDSVGKGNAINLGIKKCSGDIIVFLDADGSMRPQEITSFIEQLRSGYDFVKGSRFLPGGGSADIPFHRFLANKLFTILTNLLHGTKYTDLCYGYFAFWRQSFKDFEITCGGFEIEAEINIKIKAARLRVAEVPSFEEKRISGTGKLRSIRDGWRILRTILRPPIRN
ncbi:glycosyltransferase family 2 protein [Chloroflexota bacterium]